MHSILKAAGILAVLAVAGLAHGGTIELGWDPVSGAAGYIVFVGTDSRHYDDVFDVGPATSKSIDALDDCTNYFVAVKAYNPSGQSAAFSNEVAGWARPELSAQTLTATQGEQLVLGIEGANFQSGAEITIDPAAIPNDTFGNPLILLGPVVVVSCHRAEAVAGIEPSAAGLQAMGLGPIDLPVSVVNPGGVFRDGSLPLEILFNEARADVNQSNARTTDRVDGDDLATLVRSWASDYGDTAFEFIVDLDGDTDVDGDDLALLALVFGRCRSGEDWTAEACQNHDGT